MATLTGPRSTLKYALPLSLLVLVASRLAVVLAIQVAPSSDPAWYYARAIGLLDHGSYDEGGLPTAYWPVGYPAFLALVMAAFGRSLLVGQLANIALSAGCLLLIHRWCRLRWADPRIAAVAVMLFAVYPNQIGYAAVLFSEPLYTAMLLAMCVLARPGATAGRLILLGLLAGAATLVKAQTQLLALPLVWLLLLRDWHRDALWDATRRTLLVAVVMVLTIAPWTYRNYLQFGAVIPVSTNGGMSLLSGNNPSMTTDLATEFPDDDALMKGVGFSVKDQAAADVRARAAAKEWILDHPARFIALMPKKILRLWLWDGESEWMFQRGDPDYEQHRIGFRAARIVNQAFYLVVLATGLFAVARAVRLRQPSTLVVPLLLLFFTAICMVFSGQSRYHAPLMPFIIAASASAIVAMRQRWSRS